MAKTTRARRIALFAILTLVAAVTIQLAVAYRSEERHARLLVGSMTHAIARQVGGSLGAVDTLLAEMADMVAASRWNDPSHRERLSLRLAGMPEVIYLAVIDGSGRMLPTTLPAIDLPPAGMEVGDRDYVAGHQSGAERTLVGGPIIGRQTGKRTIPLSRPLFDAQHRRVGTVVAMIDADGYAELLAANMLDSEGASAVIRLDGVILARAPNHVEKFGSSIAGSDLLTTWIPAASHGVARLLSKADGNDKFVGYRVLEQYGLVVTSGMSTHRALGAWRLLAATEAVAVLVLSALLFQWGWKTDRREGMLLDHQDELERAVRERTAELAATTALAEKRAERLRQTHATLSRLAQAAAHQLQEPVRPIVSFTQLARRSLSSGENEAAEYLEFVEAAGTKLKSVLVAFQRYVELLSRTAKPEPVDLAELVEQLAAEMAVELAAVGGAIIAGELPALTADRGMLPVALREMIANAIEARHPERPLRIIVAAEALERGGWRISVSDNGKGVDEAVRPRLFEAFVRHRREAPGAIGLGLAMCRAIAEAHGGHIGMTTSAAGSTFTLDLAAPKADADG